MARPPPPRPLYADTAGPAPETLRPEGDARADAVIVVVGFTGLSAALHLAEQGRAARVLEAHGIGCKPEIRGGTPRHAQRRPPIDPAARGGPGTGLRLKRNAPLCQHAEVSALVQ